MDTWEDLDNESGSEKNDVEEEGNIAMGLVATMTSDVEFETDSKDENEIYSKILKNELVESLKELLTHFKNRTNELKDLKGKYVDLLKQQEKTILDPKESEKELKSFDYICKTYEGKLKYICQKHKVKCEKKPLSKQEIALEDFIISGIDRSKVAPMIYSIYHIHGRGLSFSDGIPNEINLKSCSECIKEGLKTYFVPKDVESEIVIQLEPEASSYKTANVSKSKNSKSKIMTNSESKTPKRPEPKSQVLKNSEYVVLMPKFQRRKTIIPSCETRPKILNKHKQLNFKHKAQKNT